jgi:hypothetical protein
LIGGGDEKTKNAPFIWDCGFAMDGSYRSPRFSGSRTFLQFAWVGGRVHKLIWNEGQGNAMEWIPG